MPFISIIIPVYNTGKDLNQCLESIRQQSFEDFEVVMIDDGSTDGTDKICDSFVERDPRFFVLHKENAGVATARNKGMELAKGEWVTFVDSDDWLDVHYLQAMVDCVTEHPEANLVVNTFITINTDQPVRWEKIDRNMLAAQEETLAALVREQMPTSMWCYMIRRGCLKNVAVDSCVHYYEDMDFMLQIFRQKNICAINTRGGYHYRQGSVTHRKLTKKTLSAFYMVDKQVQEGLSKELCRYLDGAMILRVAAVGAKDPIYNRELNRELQDRAVAFWRKKAACVHSKKTRFHIWMLAVSPRLVYFLQRLKRRLMTAKR